MGLMDTLKNLGKGHKKEINQGVDMAADAIAKVTPDAQDGMVKDGAAKVKEVIDDQLKD